MFENEIKNMSNATKSKSPKFGQNTEDENNFSFAKPLRNLKETLEKAKKGDKNSFSTAYEDYFKPLYRYTYLRVGNKEESDDLIQDIFIKIYDSLNNSDLALESSVACLYSIARKAIMDWNRKRRTVILSDENIENNFYRQLDGEDKSEEKKDFESLHRAMKWLPDEEQDAVIFKFMQNLSIEEIGKLLRKTKSETYHILSNGICSIRNNLKKQYER